MIEVLHVVLFNSYPIGKPESTQSNYLVNKLLSLAKNCRREFTLADPFLNNRSFLGRNIVRQQSQQYQCNAEARLYLVTECIHII